MAYYGEIEIINKEGWKKLVRIEKALLRAGTGKMNDIQFPADKGNGIAPVHFQLVRDDDANQLRLFNLTHDPLVVQQKRNRKVNKIASYGTQTLHDEDLLLLENYTLRFQLQNEHSLVLYRQTEHIGMKLELPNQDLRYGKKIEGRLTVFNLGDAPNCQVEMDLKGIEERCFSIDPAPVLYPGADEGLSIRFFHLGDAPSAGEHTVEISVHAPKSYPGENVRICFSLSVQPRYHHQLSLRLLDSDKAKEEILEQKPEIEISLGQIPVESPEVGFEELSVGAIDEQTARAPEKTTIDLLNFEIEEAALPEELILPAPNNGQDAAHPQEILKVEPHQTGSARSVAGTPAVDEFPEEMPVEEAQSASEVEPLAEADEEEGWWSEESGPVQHQNADPFSGFGRQGRFNRKEDLRNIRVVKAEEVELPDQESVGDNGRKRS
jgi:hypothetical protein